MAKKTHSMTKHQDQLVARILSPGKLFVYWQLHDEKVQFICKYFYIPEDQPTRILRLYDHDSMKVIHEVILRHGVSSWLFKGVKPTGNYYVELGIKRSREIFFPLLKSSPAIQQNESQIMVDKPLSPGWAKFSEGKHLHIL
ncbi:DUF4912 domain-containing protein [Mesobacillus subterraneus]|uniref:DUF4912 domain-containing protein n=1 Tax=Mesobacillus subterraneus TaxID=285983 RepID=UPI00273DA614|nr:DUF4912 domain-containing protein [Mesobacillus subterraneus]WLR56337.1 DUF4912 domain-containing protein [Mesobacillus subterraneus]